MSLLPIFKKKLEHRLRQRLSTETALLKVNDELYNTNDSKKISLLLLTEFPKAFDSVSHDIWLHKTKHRPHLVPGLSYKQITGSKTQEWRVLPTKNFLWCSPGICATPGPVLIYVNDLSEGLPGCVVVTVY